MSDAPRVPSSWQLEKAVAAWQRMQELLRSDPDLELDEAALWHALSIEEGGIRHPDELLARLIDAARWAELREVEAKALEAEINERRHRYERRKESLRATILDLLQALDKRNHPGTLARALIVKGRESVVILDEQLVPDRFCKTERTVLKTPIHEAIDAGEEVPGAVLSNAGETLQIRKL